METTHVFNEKLRRFEPTDSKCMFCDEGFSQNMNDNLFITLFKVKGRSNIIVYRSVKFNKILVGVSRCKSCGEIHKSTILLSRLFGFGIPICAIILIFVLVEDNLAAGGKYVKPVAAVGCLLLGFWLLPSFFEKILAERKNILCRRDGAKGYQIVRDLLDDGWSFDAPSP